jgi:hypothetical protein
LNSNLADVLKRDSSRPNVQLVSVSENLGGIQAEAVKTQYKKIFEIFLPKIKVQRDKISHEYEHALKRDLIGQKCGIWSKIWRN